MSLQAKNKTRGTLHSTYKPSPLVDEGLGIGTLWRSRRRGGRVGIRIVSSHSKELEVPTQLVIESVVSVSGLEVLPILLAEDAEVIRGYAVPAEVGHGLEVVVGRWFPEFGRWDRGYSRDGGENFVTTSLGYERRFR